MFSPAKLFQGAAALAQRLVGTPERGAGAGGRDPVGAGGGGGGRGVGKSKLGGKPAGGGSRLKKAAAPARGSKGLPRAAPSKPTRASSAYLCFCQTHREEVTRGLRAGAKPTEVTKALAERWNKATTAEKSAAEKVAAKDKARYEKELEAFKKKLAVFEAKAQAAVDALPGGGGPRAPQSYKKAEALKILKKMKAGLGKRARDPTFDTLVLLVEGGQGPLVEAAASKHVFKEKGAGRANYRAFLTEVFGPARAEELFIPPAKK